MKTLSGVTLWMRCALPLELIGAKRLALYQLVREDNFYQMKIRNKLFKLIFVKAKTLLSTGGPAWGAYDWRSNINDFLCNKIEKLLQDKMLRRLRATQNSLERQKT